MANETKIQGRLDYLCNLESGYVWTEHDRYDVLQLRTELTIAINGLKKDAELLGRLTSLLR